MRILITRSSENQTIGGAELSARDQALVLKELGHEPFFMSNNARIRQELSAAGIKSYQGLYLQRFSPPWRYAYFWLLFPLKFLLDIFRVYRLKPDIVNPHTREDHISFTLTKRLHRRPVIWKDPGDMLFVFNRTHGFWGRWYKSLYVRAIKKADHIYALNQEHIDIIVQYIGDAYRSKFSVITSSILYDQYHPDRDSHHHGPLVFGSICRLTKEKNVRTLILAFHTLAKKYPEVKLVIAGYGPQQKELRDLAANTTNIAFTGRFSDVSPLLNQIDVVVHPAIEEGWGRVIKEAMYFGKPIIGANVGGVKQQIDDGESGLLFDPSNVDELVKKMRLLVENDTLRNTLGHNAYRKAVHDGDFTDVVKSQILPLYTTFTQ